MNPADLRSTMRTFATGVCLATTYRDVAGTRHHDAVTVNSLGSISLAPPLVSLCFRRGSAFLGDLLHTGCWAVSILSAAERETARQLAGPAGARAHHVAGLRARPGRHTGALVPAGAAWLECALHERLDLGDHTLVVGEVLGAGVNEPSPALVFLHGNFHELVEAVPERRDPTSHGHWGEVM